MWLSTPVWSYSLVSKICCRLHAREISNDQPFPESITVSVEPSFTSISHSNDITFISKCHSLIVQIRLMLGVPSLAAQQYPIDLFTSVHHDYEVSRFQIHRWLHYSFTETPSPLVMCDYTGYPNYLEEFGVVVG